MDGLLSPRTREVGYLRGKSMSSVAVHLASKGPIGKHHPLPWAHSKLLSAGVWPRQKERNESYLIKKKRDHFHCPKYQRPRFEEQSFKQSYATAVQWCVQATYSPPEQWFAKVERRDTTPPEITDSTQNHLVQAHSLVWTQFSQLERMHSRQSSFSQLLFQIIFSSSHFHQPLPR